MYLCILSLSLHYTMSVKFIIIFVDNIKFTDVKQILIVKCPRGVEEQKYRYSDSIPYHCTRGYL